MCAKLTASHYRLRHAAYGHPFGNTLVRTFYSPFACFSNLSTQIGNLLMKMARTDQIWLGLGDYFKGAFGEIQFFRGIGQIVKAVVDAL